MIEVREITTYNEDSKINGYGIWVVVEQINRRTHIIHPVSMSELYMTEYEYAKAVGKCLWPYNNTPYSFNKERFVDNFKNRIETLLKINKSFPVNTVVKVLCELDNMTALKAMQFIGVNSIDAETGESINKLSNKTNRIYDLKEGVDIRQFTGRQYALLKTFQEHGSASIYQITSLVEGKLKTKSSLSRVVTYFVNKLASQGILEIVA